MSQIEERSLSTRKTRRRRSSNSAAKPKQNSTLSLGLVLNVIRQWWYVCTPIGLLLAAVASAVVFATFEPQYRASVMIRIRENDPYLIFHRASSNTFANAFVNNQRALIRSPLVLTPIAAQEEVAAMPELANVDNPAAAIRNYVNLSSSDGSSEYYNITCTSRSAKAAAAVANAVAESYLERVSFYNNARYRRLISLLDDQKQISEREVKRLRETVRAMALRTTGEDPFSKNNNDENAVARSAASKLEIEQADLNMKRATLDAKIRRFKALIQKTPVTVPDYEVEQKVREHPEYKELQGSILQMENQVKEIERRATNPEKYAGYKPLLEKIAAKKKLLDELATSLKGDLAAEIERTQIEGREKQLKQWEAELAQYGLVSDVMKEQYEKEVEKIKQYRGDTLELEFRSTELKRAETALAAFSDRLFEETTEREGPGRVEKMLKASVPGRPVESIPWKKIALAGAATFIFPFILAFLWEMKIRRVNDTAQLESSASLQVVGEIARIPSNPTRGSKRNSRGLRLFQESVDNLRTSLTLSDELIESQVFSVASASSREGKTTVATQLAVSIARASGEPTLLIDGDMRAPDIHEIFDVEGETGLVQVLGGADLDDEVIDWGQNLYLLPAGRLDANPHKLLGEGGRWQEIIDQARQQYRYVVIDTPPCLAAGEALVMARSADAAIVCTMRDVSRVEQVIKTRRRLEDAGVNVVGCVLSGVPTNRYAYRYGSYDYVVYPD